MFIRLWSFVILLFTATNILAQLKSGKPNILIIMADDLGWADLKTYGSTFYETPQLDKLASQGIKFTNGYASCPVCSPTRASLLTGKYPVKTGITDWIKGRQANGKARPYEKLIGPAIANQLQLQEETIAEIALQNGYNTFFSGKWHLGDEDAYYPENQGFQTNKGGFGSGSPMGFKNDSTGGYFTPYNNPRLNDGPAGEYLTDRLTNECLQFLNQSKDKPFLLTYSLYAVHNPLQAPKALIKKYEQKQQQLMLQSGNPFTKNQQWMQNENGWKQRTIQSNPVYAAMIENMDQNIGKILQKLDDMGIAGNTLVIFTSDNGGLSTAEGSPTVNGPLRAGKGWLYEGGIRVPLLMRWPAKFAGDQNTNVPINTIDFFPTIARAINNSYVKSDQLDGRDVFELLKRPEKAANRALFWHYPHYSNQGGKPGSAIIKGNYKLIYNYEDSTSELYDIKNDLGETRDIAFLNKPRVKQLRNELFAWLKKTGAQFPVNNPGYNAALNLPAAKQVDD